MVNSGRVAAIGWYDRWGSVPDDVYPAAIAAIGRFVVKQRSV